jgi:uncharacterized pyridoxamine 5'-phosphate oxidase family protein
MKIPPPDRPFPLPGYGIPEDEAGLLSWEVVAECMKTSRNYWVATISPQDRPHVVPVWGVWLDDTLYFGGGPGTRWFRNLQANPRVVVHLDDSDHAVIFEGRVILAAADADSPLLPALDDVYEAKYNMRHGPPIWKLLPEKVFAWQEYPTTVTRWVFEG